MNQLEARAEALQHQLDQVCEKMCRSTPRTRKSWGILGEWFARAFCEQKEGTPRNCASSQLELQRLGIPHEQCVQVLPSLSLPTPTTYSVITAGSATLYFHPDTDTGCLSARCSSEFKRGTVNCGCSACGVTVTFKPPDNRTRDENGER